MDEKPRGPKRASARPSLGVTLALALFPALLLALVPIGLVEDAEWGLYDVRMRLRNRLSPQPLSEELVLVGLTEFDSRQIGEEISTRAAHQQLLRALREAGVGLVVFDIFFEQERPKDDLLALRLREVDAVLAYKVDDYFRREAPAGENPPNFEPVADIARKTTDTARLMTLASEQLRDYSDKLSGYIEEKSALMSEEDRLEMARLMAWTRYWRWRLVERWMELEWGKEFEAGEAASPMVAQSSNFLSPSLIGAADALGIANIDKSEESVVRRAPLVFEYNGRLYPNLDLAALHVWYGADWEETKIEWGRAITINPTERADAPIAIPIDGKGRYLINYREGEDFLRRGTSVALSAAAGYVSDEAKRQRLAAAWEDAIVLVGEMVAGSAATDIEPIPLQPAFPMVGMHANILDNVLRRDFLTLPPMGARFSILLAGGVLAGMIFWLLPFARAARMMALALVAYIVVNYALFAGAGLVLPLAAPVFATVAQTLVLFAYIVGVAERDRRLVKDVFLRTVSPRIGEEILRNYANESLWGTRREISVLFVDIRGYTTLSETHDADVVLGILDRFYDTVSEIVFRHEGQVNKFLGDAVLALFGAMPEEAPNHAERALRAAADVQRAMDRLAEEPKLKELGIRLATGAGVNTGEAITGIVGRRRIRIEFTALGDAVNLASRLQGLATTDEIVAGDGTLAHIGGPDAPVFKDLGCELEKVTGVSVKGKAEALTVWKVRLREEGASARG
ncbi:MAG: adenylate/guanylate cyclase domain-containing protein [Sumerlaeia bacterium]